MTIPVSTVPAATTYLLGAIQAQVATDPLYQSMLVGLGQMNEGQYRPNDIITVDGAHRSQVPTTVIGSGAQFWLNEVYDLEVNINTWQEVTDLDGSITYATQINNRAWQLVGYVETAIRNDPSFGDLLNQAYPREAQSTGPMWTERPPGLLVGVTIQVQCEVLN